VGDASVHDASCVGKEIDTAKRRLIAAEAVFAAAASRRTRIEGILGDARATQSSLTIALRLAQTAFDLAQ